MATSDGAGNYKISGSGYTPPADCTVDVNDGSARATTIRLIGSTPTAATAAILPDRPELGPFAAGVRLGATVVSFAGSIGPDSWQIVGGALPSGLTMTVPANAAAVPNADAVSVSQAEYDTAKHQLRVAATSSGVGATLRVYFTGTNTLIGTLSAGSGQFSLPVNPLNITVRSSLGGTAARAVTAR